MPHQHTTEKGIVINTDVINRTKFAVQLRRDSKSKPPPVILDASRLPKHLPKNYIIVASTMDQVPCTIQDKSGDFYLWRVMRRLPNQSTVGKYVHFLNQSVKD